MLTVKHETIPPELKEVPHWVVWKAGPVKHNGKFDKVPVHHKTGSNLTGEILPQCITFGEAVAAYQTGGFSGLGFYPKNTEFVIGDIDGVVGEDGHIADWAIEDVDRLGTYCEVSPSGRGLRWVAIGRKPGPETNNQAQGCEMYYKDNKQFLTITGHVLPGFDIIRADIQPAVNAWYWSRVAKSRTTTTVAVTDGPGNSLTPEEVQARLLSNPKMRKIWEGDTDDYDSRSEAELALLDALAVLTAGDIEKMREVYFESEFAKETYEDKAERTFEGTARKAIQGMQDRFIRGNGLCFADIAGPEDTVSLVPIEYVVEGFLSTGCTYIGGAHGIGKSSLLTPLTAMITGEIPSTLGLSVTLVRMVIYLAEDMDQIRRARFALIKHHGLVENGKFLLRQAARRPPEAIGSLIAEIVEQHTIPGPCGYAVKPLIIFDTTNANFEIENENDSQAVGRIISAIKTNSKGAPVWLIGHVAKNLVRADFETLSGRGSGAWEADSQQTAFIFADAGAPEDTRFFGTKKIRFEPQFREIQIHTTTDSETIETPWGQTQTIVLRHGLPTRGSKIERENARERVREERKQEKARGKREEAEATILGLLKDIPEPITKTKLVEKANERGLARDFARAVLTNLIERGVIDAACEVRAGAVTKYDGLQLAKPSW